MTSRSEVKMITAAEILDAVKKGGSENWKTSSTDKPRPKRNKTQAKKEDDLTRLLNTLDKVKPKKVKDCAKLLGWSDCVAQKWLVELCARNKAKRIRNREGFQYWRL